MNTEVKTRHLDLSRLRRFIGLGVAGNFAGHLEQAGEAADFKAVKAEEGAPKGLFPFYVPSQTGHFVEVFPLSSTSISRPLQGGNLQAEPEVALVCDLEYSGGLVTAVLPRAFAAYNDCSIRRPGAKKISEKKNWGPESKGVSGTAIEIEDQFSSAGAIGSYHIASFLRRHEGLHEYGIDSPIAGYSYFGGQLLEWVAQQLNTQKDQGPLEDIRALLSRSGHPESMLISIGATRYTDYGEKTFLQEGDESIVLLYDPKRHGSARDLVEQEPGDLPGDISMLRLQVV